MKETKSTVATGRNYEDLALDYLINQGLTLVQRNYRVQDGEIDLIMREQGYLIFIEVKYRKDARFSEILEQIQAVQLARIRRTAQLFFLQHGIIEHLTACRFDIVTLGGSPLKIQWLKDAF